MTIWNEENIEEFVFEQIPKKHWEKSQNLKVRRIFIELIFVLFHPYEAVNTLPKKVCRFLDKHVIQLNNRYERPLLLELAFRIWHRSRWISDLQGGKDVKEEDLFEILKSPKYAHVRYYFQKRIEEIR